jgi:hypothetical protein
MPRKRSAQSVSAPLAGLAFLTVLAGAMTPREAVGMLVLSWFAGVMPSRDRLNRTPRRHPRK